MDIAEQFRQALDAVRDQMDGRGKGSTVTQDELVQHAIAERLASLAGASESDLKSALLTDDPNYTSNEARAILALWEWLERIDPPASDEGEAVEGDDEEPVSKVVDMAGAWDAVRRSADNEFWAVPDEAAWKVSDNLIERLAGLIGMPVVNTQRALYGEAHIEQADSESAVRLNELLTEMARRPVEVIQEPEIITAARKMVSEGTCFQDVGSRRELVRVMLADERFLDAIFKVIGTGRSAMVGFQMMPQHHAAHIVSVVMSEGDYNATGLQHLLVAYDLATGRIDGAKIQRLVEVRRELDRLMWEEQALAREVGDIQPATTAP